MRSTIGLCKDCGYTWEVRFRKKKKLSWLKNKTWLWVLGWLYIFPLPLTILLSRKRRMNPVAKYGIIAASWILYISFYIAIGIAAVSSDSATSNNSATAPLEFEMIAGEAGDYGRPLTLNAGTEFEDNTIGYFVPAGTYSVKNIGEYRTQVNVYKNEINVTSEGWEEWADGGCVVLQVGESKEIVVWDGYFLDIFIGSPSKILITKLS